MTSVSEWVAERTRAARELVQRSQVPSGDTLRQTDLTVTVKLTRKVNYRDEEDLARIIDQISPGQAVEDYVQNGGGALWSWQDSEADADDGDGYDVTRDDPDDYAYDDGVLSMADLGESNDDLNEGNDDARR